jgi:hypothetical protein
VSRGCVGYSDGGEWSAIVGEMNRRREDSRSRYGRFEEEKNFLPLLGSNHDSSAL